ncbi:hypothetical protein ECANGB1_1669 [Enterospora canceri]|uniref:Uncharacterized protein n=1 Tax=Enterospora canceri TaxID=1081671 RepID=A0A1Y1S978_9MICR|nr:hypothetical protein ECANGB1_1669 [Enterospora canceri]
MDVSKEQLSDKYITELWEKLPESEKIYFYGEIEHGSLEVKNPDSLCYDGQICTGIKRTQYDESSKLDAEEFLRNAFYLPEHELGTVKRNETGYKANVFYNRHDLPSFNSKTLEMRDNASGKNVPEDDGLLWGFSNPSFSYNSDSFKNYLLYAYYGIEPYKQNSYRTNKEFYRENNLKEVAFVEACKNTLTYILMSQDTSITFNDARQVADGLYGALELGDLVYLYENRIRNLVV